MRGRIFGMVAVAALAATAMAQPYYARGEFNGWGLGNVLIDLGGGLWHGMVGGQTPGQEYNYKIAVEDWSRSWPGSDGRVPADSAGEIHFNFFDIALWSDGWFPNDRERVGYVDPGQFAWEIMGSFNGWTGPALSLTDMGSGVWAGDLVVPTAGVYEWKFRKEGDWSISIGDDFGNSAANNVLTTGVPNQTVHFELDLPNGRFVPEPASLACLGIGFALVLRRRR